MTIENKSKYKLDVVVVPVNGSHEPLWTVSIDAGASASKTLPADRAPYIPSARFAACPELDYNWLLPQPHSVPKEGVTVTITSAYAGFDAKVKTD